jgi:hypothetical protein
LATASLIGILQGVNANPGLAIAISVLLGVSLGSSGFESWRFEVPPLALIVMCLSITAAGLAGSLHGGLWSGVVFGAAWYITARIMDQQEVESDYAGHVLVLLTLIMAMMGYITQDRQDSGQRDTTIGGIAAGVSICALHYCYGKLTARTASRPNTRM